MLPFQSEPCWGSFSLPYVAAMTLHPTSHTKILAPLPPIRCVTSVSKAALTDAFNWLKKNHFEAKSLCGTLQEAIPASPGKCTHAPFVILFDTELCVSCSHHCRISDRRHPGASGQHEMPFVVTNYTRRFQIILGRNS